MGRRRHLATVALATLVLITNDANILYPSPPITENTSTTSPISSQLFSVADNVPRQAALPGELEAETRWVVVLKSPSFWDQFVHFLREGSLLDVLERGETTVEELGAESVGTVELSKPVVGIVADEQTVMRIRQNNFVQEVFEAERLDSTVVRRDVGTGSDSPWGLDRLDQRSRTLDGHYHHSNDGSGTFIYVLDSGLDTSNSSEFPPSRVERYAVWPTRVGPGDCDGHGTHVAGTAAGQTVGVASGANLVSIRLSGWYSFDRCAFDALDLIFGMEDAYNHWRQNGKPPAVMNLSLGGSANSRVDDEVRWLTRQGMTIVAAAGNAPVGQSAQSACTISPARAQTAITVAATNKNDQRTSWSYFGRCVDLFAPGEGIVSVRANGGGLVSLSGTSMAAPHVAGLAARYLQDNPRANPAAVKRALASGSLQGIVGNPGAGSPNRLANSLFLEGGELTQLRTPNLSNLRIGQAPNGTITVRGGRAPLDYSVVSGSLPPGLSIDSAGRLSGTVSSYGGGTATVRISDAVGQKLDADINWSSIGVPDTTAASSLVSTPGNRLLSIGLPTDITSADSARGSAIVRVEVRAVPESGRARSCSVNQRGGVLPESCSITGLTNDTEYSLEIRARNGAGWSAWSTSDLDPESRTPVPVAPSVVRSVQVQERAGQVQIRWAQPANDGGAPPTYRVEFQTTGSEWTAVPGCENLTVRQRSCQHTQNLSWGEPTTYRVNASNSRGSSDWTAGNRVATPFTTAALAGVVSGGVSSVPGNRVLGIDWGSRFTDQSVNQGAPVVSVQVRAVPEDVPEGLRASTRTCTVNQRVGVFAEGCTITGLVNEVSYRLEVRARNAAGWSAWAVSDITQIDRTPVPVAPSVVRSVNVRERANFVEVRWSQPANDGGAPPTYSVEYQSGSDSWLVVPGCDSLTSRQRVCQHREGLTWGESTQYRVNARNTQGSSDWVFGNRPATPFTTPFIAPAAQGSISSTPDDRRLIVGWGTTFSTREVDRGAAIVEVQVRAVPEGRASTRTCSARVSHGVLADGCTITGLVNGMTYTMEVRARNAAGWSRASWGGVWKPVELNRLLATPTAQPLVFELSAPTAAGMWNENSDTSAVNSRLVVGDVLRARGAGPQDWGSPLDDPTVSYQWMRSGTPIPGATMSWYQTQPADIGAEISVRIHASGPLLVSQTIEIGPSGVALREFEGIPTQFVIDALPSVGLGTAVPEQSWMAGRTLSYQWVVDGEPIAGATAPQVLLEEAARWGTLEVVITISAPGYHPHTATGVFSEPIGMSAEAVFMDQEAPALFVSSPYPEGLKAMRGVGDLLLIGETLGVSITPPTGWTVTAIQWFRSGSVGGVGSAISGATGETVLVTETGEYWAMVTLSHPDFDDYLWRSQPLFTDDSDSLLFINRNFAFPALIWSETPLRIVNTDAINDPERSDLDWAVGDRISPWSGDRTVAGLPSIPNRTWTWTCQRPGDTQPSLLGTLNDPIPWLDLTEDLIGCDLRVTFRAGGQGTNWYAYQTASEPVRFGPSSSDGSITITSGTWVPGEGVASTYFVVNFDGVMPPVSPGVLIAESEEVPLFAVVDPDDVGGGSITWLVEDMATFSNLSGDIQGEFEWNGTTYVITFDEWRAQFEAPESLADVPQYPSGLGIDGDVVDGNLVGSIQSWGNPTFAPGTLVRLYSYPGPVQFGLVIADSEGIVQAEFSLDETIEAIVAVGQDTGGNKTIKSYAHNRIDLVYAVAGAGTNKRIVFSWNEPFETNMVDKPYIFSICFPDGNNIAGERAIPEDCMDGDGFVVDPDDEFLSQWVVSRTSVSFAFDEFPFPETDNWSWIVFQVDFYRDDYPVLGLNGDNWLTFSYNEIDSLKLP